MAPETVQLYCNADLCSNVHQVPHPFLPQHTAFLLDLAQTLTLALLCMLPPGTKVNWTAAIRPPHHVRKEWASTYGLAHLGPDSTAFDSALDTVCAKLGVGVGTTMSTQNVKLQEGLRALGEHVEE